MSRSILEKNALEVFDRAHLDLIDCNLDDLDNDFEYLFRIPLFLVYCVNWRRTNNLSAIIDRSQQRRDLLSDSMFILNDSLAEIAMQDIGNADSVRATQTPFITLFDTKTMANFYAIICSFSLACYYFEKHKDSNIEDDTSQSPNNLALGQKWEIIRHVKFGEPYWILNNIIAIIR